MNRLCIYPKDIMIITGRSDRYGRNLIKKIKNISRSNNTRLLQLKNFASTWDYN